MVRWLVLTTAIRSQAHAQPPAHGLPHEGQPAPGRASPARPVEGGEPVREGARGAARRAALRPPRRARPTRTATSTWAPSLNKILKDLVMRSRTHGRPRRALRAGLGLPRPAHRAAGGQEPGREEEGHDAGGVPPRVPGLRREVRGHPARGVRAAGDPRGVGAALSHDGPRLPGHDRAPARRPSSRKGSSTRPRSRCTGASPAAPPSPRRRWSTTSATSARR